MAVKLKMQRTYWGDKKNSSFIFQKLKDKVINQKT